LIKPFADKSTLTQSVLFFVRPGRAIATDPHAHDKLANVGQIAFDFGQFWFKGQKMGTGGRWL
jgi:hypothetical protein